MFNKTAKFFQKISFFKNACERLLIKPIRSGPSELKLKRMVSEKGSQPAKLFDIATSFYK